MARVPGIIAPKPLPAFILNHRRASSSTGASTSAVAVAARREPLGPRHSDAKHLKALSEAEEKERMKVRAPPPPSPTDWLSPSHVVVVHIAYPHRNAGPDEHA
jgi:hypothetical protein